MNRTMTLQAAMDRYLQHGQSGDRADAEVSVSAAQVLEELAQYLVHYSDLFQDQEEGEMSEFADWEEGLEEHMARLLEGDLEPSSNLGSLPLSALDPEHLRDFLGWFLLRETTDGDVINAYADALKAWVGYMRDQGWLDHNECFDFTDIVIDTAESASRTARVSQVLYHFVRSGTGVSPSLRAHRFSRFVEGHGRVSRIHQQQIWFNFENSAGEIGPVALPQVIVDLIEAGDVFDVELGLRGECWVIVDIGPVYPPGVYVEVEEYQGLEKLS